MSIPNLNDHNTFLDHCAITCCKCVCMSTNTKVSGLTQLGIETTSNIILHDRYTLAASYHFFNP